MYTKIITRHYVNITQRGWARNWKKFQRFVLGYIFTLVIKGPRQGPRIQSCYLIATTQDHQIEIRFYL
jgi:hypothetical protein